MITYSRAA